MDYWQRFLLIHSDMHLYVRLALGHMRFFLAQIQIHNLEEWADSVDRKLMRFYSMFESYNYISKYD